MSSNSVKVYEVKAEGFAARYAGSKEEASTLMSKLIARGLNGARCTELVIDCRKSEILAVLNAAASGRPLTEVLA